MKNFFVVILFPIFLQALYLQAQPALNLGVNLDDNGAFVNIINHTNRFSKALSYDSLGFPKSDFDLVLLDGRPATEWAGTIDDPEKYRVNYSGRYKGVFLGSSDIAASGTSVTIENKQYNSQTNTTTFDVVVSGYPNDNHALVFLSFTNSKRTPQSQTNTGITGLRINRPGYELNSPKIFTDEFIALCKAANFACYRYYNLQNIWDGEPTYPAKTTWQMRKTPNDVSQRTLASINGKRDGWCWEYIIALANILEKDIWVCVHMSCDSAYVNSLAKMLKDNLKPAINLYIENSNEVWSPTQATHGPYNKAVADAFKITFDDNYARRCVELSNWFANVFGKNEINKKVRVILAGQHSYSGRSDNHLNYIKKNLGEPKNFIYATSSALYFGSTKATSNDPLQINEGMIEEINDQISNPQVSTYRNTHINKAKQWGLVGGCTSYEGGPHLPAGGGTNNLANQILSHRTPRMADVIKNNYQQGWRDLGGGLAMYFTLNSTYNRYGCWGLTDDYTKPDRNYKMKAIRDLIGNGTTNIENNSQEKDANTYVANIISVTPNPAKADFTTVLRLYEDEDVWLNLFNSSGKNVYSFFMKATQGLNQFRIGTNSLGSGVYELQIKTKHKLLNHKIIIVR